MISLINLDENRKTVEGKTENFLTLPYVSSGARRTETKTRLINCLCQSVDSLSVSTNLLNVEDALSREENQDNNIEFSKIFLGPKDSFVKYLDFYLKPQKG